MAKLAYTETYYGVRIDGVTGAKLAMGESGGRKLFGNRTDAVAFKDELEPHLTPKCRVIKIYVTFEEA